MITLEKLDEFTHEDLRYKSEIKVVSYKIIGNWIDLSFDTGKGEVVSADRFYNWLNERREEKLSKLFKVNICEDFNISISTLNRKIRSFNKNSISL